MSDNPSVLKPRSMPAGARNVVRSNDSASLWNCTLSPGWTEDESETLRKAVIKFGVGNWAKIIESNCLPGKTNAQMNLQLQRLLGQQSTGEFAGLHIDPKVIGERNSKIQGPQIKRKNNTIVNTGAKLSREELKKRLQYNKETYELPDEIWKSIELPKPRDSGEMSSSSTPLFVSSRTPSPAPSSASTSTAASLPIAKPKPKPKKLSPPPVHDEDADFAMALMLAQEEDEDFG
ncbi:hypothetical protein BC937DRAFT_92218, partial [Endogone sp. FLAS-F59071]